jgi:hypothetical protein
MKSEVICMECPYCKNEMKHGSIDVDDTLSWTPDGEYRKGPTRFTIARNGVLLARYYLLQSASCEASY